MISYKEHTIKSSAPALTRGLDVLDVLSDGRSYALYELSDRIGVPKASLLRLLHTLRERRLTVRDADGRYRGLCRIVSLDPTGGPSGPEVEAILRELSRATGETAEWFVRAVDGALLVQQAEPREQEIRVVARIGFLRAWVGELDAVNTLAWAGNWSEQTPPKGCWVYDANTKQKALSVSEARRRIAQAVESGESFDTCTNPNGVSRAARGVFRGGHLAGIVSVASFEGRKRSGHVDRFLPELAEAARRLGDENRSTFGKETRTMQRKERLR